MNDRWAPILSALLIILATDAVSQENLRVTFDGDTLSPDARKTIVEALAPESPYAALVDLATTPGAAIATESIVRSFDTRNEINRAIAGYQNLESNQSNSVFITSQGNRNYVLIDRATEIAGRLGIETPPVPPRGLTGLHGPLMAGPTIPNLEASNAWAIELDATQLSRLNAGNPVVPSDLAALQIERTEADPIIDRVSRELEAVGISSLRIPADDLSPEQVNALTRRFEADGARVDPEPVGDRPDVEQDIPEGVELLSVAGGACGTADDDWPMPIEQVEEVLEFNNSVLERNGISASRRARILVVDSGISSELAEHEYFSRFLKPDLARALRRGFYWTRVTDLDGTQTCDPGLDGRVGSSAFGFASNMQEDACSAILPVGGLTPFSPDPLPLKYEPDHGGFVGVLAAGGPELIGSQHSLARNLSIGFAKIMSEENGKLQSGSADVIESLRYAQDNHYDVVNMSLGFQYGVSSVAQSALLCTVSPSENCRDVSGRLIVAAAGNVPTELSQSSFSFPANVATDQRFRDTGRIIVVGGLEQNSSGSIVPWKGSSYHSEFVDILAPSAGVVSLDGMGKLACMDGTSTAAPQVSFVAGMLFSYGYTEAREVRERILATASHRGQENDKFRESAKNGRVLDIPAALDVFSDLLYLKQTNGSETKLRGMLVPETNDLKGVVIQICRSDDPGLEGDSGRKDADQFSLWRNLSDDEAEVWAHGFSRGASSKCKFDPGSRVYFKEYYAAVPHSYKLSQISRIVPSHFRRAMTEFSDW